MNILRRYTRQTLRVNRRRTLFTCMGIIISVAMITAVSVFSTSFLDYLKRKAIFETGDWELAYSELSPQEIELIKTDNRVAELFSADDLGYAELAGGQNEFKPYWFVRALDDEGFANLGIQLITGRLPENENELLISEHVGYNGGVEFQLGQTVTLQLGERILSEDPDHPLNQSNPFDPEQSEMIVKTTERSYTVVGVMKRSELEYRWAPGYTAFTKQAEATALENPVFYLKFKNASQAPQKNFPQLESKLYPNFAVNENVLRFSGPFWDNTYFFMVASAATLTLIIILTGSIFLIYNAFAISLAERSRQFGLLASIGATARQKFWCVVQEGLMIALIAVPIGLFAGWCGMAVTLKIVNPMLQSMNFISADVPLEPVISLSAVGLTVVCSVVMILLSCWLPALRAARMTPIQAIRQSQDIKLKRHHLWLGRGVRKVIGLEGELALKNIQRSGRKAWSTILSLAVSLILFTSVSSILTMMIQAVGLTYQDELSDAWVTDYSSRSLIEQKDSFEEIRQLDSVASAQRITITYAVMDTANLPLDSAWDTINDPYPVILFALDDQTYAQILAENHVEAAAMHSSSKEMLHGIVLNRYRSEISENGQRRYFDIPYFNTLPDELTLHIGDAGEVLTVKPLALAAQMDLYSQDIQYSGQLSILIPASDLEVILRGAEGSRTYNDKLYLRAKKGQQEAMVKQIDEIGKQNLTHSFSYHSPVQNQKDEKTLLIVVSIFVYGFITLICLVCLVNVINTISTNMELRRKEFAMLRSVGMAEKQFNRMIRLESIFYGLAAAVIGIPISVVLIHLLHYNLMSGSFLFSFDMPWMMILGGSLILILMVMAMMNYATHKIRRESIIETLKEEN